MELPRDGSPHFLDFHDNSMFQSTTGKANNSLDLHGMFTPENTAVPKNKIPRHKVSELVNENELLKKEVENLKNNQTKEREMFNIEIQNLKAELIHFYELEKKEMNQLLMLERESRVLMEKKAGQMVKCMKSSAKKKEKYPPSPDYQLFEQLNGIKSSADEDYGDPAQFSSTESGTNSISQDPLMKDSNGNAASCTCKSSLLREDPKEVKQETEKNMIPWVEKIQSTVHKHEKDFCSVKKECLHDGDPGKISGSNGECTTAINDANPVSKKELKKTELGRKEQLVTQMGKMKNTIFKLEEDMNVFGQVADRFTGMKKELNKKQCLISRLQKDLMAHEENAAELTKKAQVTTCLLEKSKRDKENLDNSLIAVKEEMFALKSENEKLKKDIAETTEALRTTKRENIFLKKEVTRVEKKSASEIKQLKCTVLRLRGTIDRIKEDHCHEVSRKAISAISDMVVSMKKELDVKHNIISTLQKDYITVREDLKDSKTKLQEKENELEVVKFSKNDMEQFLKGLQEEITNLQLRNEHFEKS